MEHASTGPRSMPPQMTSFEPLARPPVRKPYQGDLILFSQTSSIWTEGRPFSALGAEEYASSCGRAA
jgi:hypothetical protein